MQVENGLQGGLISQNKRSHSNHDIIIQEYDKYYEWGVLCITFCTIAVSIRKMYRFDLGLPILTFSFTFLSKGTWNNDF